MKLLCWLTIVLLSLSGFIIAQDEDASDMESTTISAENATVESEDTTDVLGMLNTAAVLAESGTSNDTESSLDGDLENSNSTVTNSSLSESQSANETISDDHDASSNETLSNDLESSSSSSSDIEGHESEPSQNETNSENEIDHEADQNVSGEGEGSGEAVSVPESVPEEGSGDGEEQDREHQQVPPQRSDPMVHVEERPVDGEEQPEEGRLPFDQPAADDIPAKVSIQSTFKFTQEHRCLNFLRRLKSKALNEHHQHPLSCPSAFDGILCWRPADPNETLLQLCPDGPSDQKYYVKRECVDGAWREYHPLVNARVQPPVLSTSNYQDCHRVVGFVNKHIPAGVEGLQQVPVEEYTTRATAPPVALRTQLIYNIEKPVVTEAPVAPSESVGTSEAANVPVSHVPVEDQQVTSGQEEAGQENVQAGGHGLLSFFTGTTQSSSSPVGSSAPEDGVTGSTMALTGGEGKGNMPNWVLDNATACETFLRDSGLLEARDGGCPGGSDGALCWPTAGPGSLVNLSCPNVGCTDPTKCSAENVSRVCGDDGQWSAADYSKCPVRQVTPKTTSSASAVFNLPVMSSFFFMLLLSLL